MTSLQTHQLPSQEHYTQTLDTKKVFGCEIPFPVKAFNITSEHVPAIDESYVFDPNTTLAILAGFMFNRRVIIQGYHGTGKSTHIEQVAARLNWPCIRVNLDSHISRLDLIGRDGIVLEQGKQVTRFLEGILPWSLRNPVALCFDEYDAARADVMFVIQRVLEANGALTLLDQNQVLHPHNFFRLFATTNTIGLGDTSGLYHGTQQINQGQMDRWSILAQLNYLPRHIEEKIVLGKIPTLNNNEGKSFVERMIAVAELTRSSFINGEISTVMSPRTVISWAENTDIFNNPHLAFQLSFLNRCDESEQSIIAEHYQRVFNHDIFKTSDS
jgi:cobaltochelatase CobS